MGENEAAAKSLVKTHQTTLNFTAPSVTESKKFDIIGGTPFLICW